MKHNGNMTQAFPVAHGLVGVVVVVRVADAVVP